MSACQQVELLDFLSGFPARFGLCDGEAACIGVLVDHALAETDRRDVKLVLLKPLGRRLLGGGGRFGDCLTDGAEWLLPSCSIYPATCTGSTDASS